MLRVIAKGNVMLDAKTLLVETAKFFAMNPNKWTRHTLAQNRMGHSVRPNDPDACRFCAVGYMAKLLGNSTAPYAAVDHAGLDSRKIHDLNDRVPRPEDVVAKLTEMARGLD